jgi:hypothetical protein
VEFFGSIIAGEVKPTKTIFAAIQEPCTPVPAEVHSYGQLLITGEKLFAEFFPPQGSAGHICAFAFDAEGRVIAVGTYAKNPVKFEGAGEVIFGNVDLKLEPLSAPAPVPKGITP